MKKLFIFAAGLITLASCTNNDFVGDEAIKGAVEEAPISFGFDVPAPTRAGGLDAATALSNQFIVYAEKSEKSDGTAAADGNLVFPNYQVNWVDNSAYTTTSNTKNWEYVGYTHSDAYKSNILPQPLTAAAQTIKYWDYSATNYVFTAVSALPEDITSGKVKITKITSAQDGNKIYDKGYTIKVTDNANLEKLYFADRLQIDKSNDADRTQVNYYGGIATLTFRNAIAKIRVGMYETIPGYDVKIDKFYYVNSNAPTFANMSIANETNFAANVPNFAPESGKTSVEGTFTVKYYPVNTENDAAGISNHPTVSFSGSASAKNFLTLGSGINSATKLNETSALPTFDKTGGDFSIVFPQETNSKNLKLKVDYTLSNAISGETIKVKGATAEIPSQYLQWRANFKYTYLFKISDNTNGHTGEETDPAGLYPITFDALVVASEEGNTEYITTVSEPSITTYAKASDVTVDNEYKVGAKVYAVVEDNSGLATLNATNMKLYTVAHKTGLSEADKAAFPITEASVAEALAEKPCMTAAELANAKIVLTDATFNYGKTVIDSDGSTITMDATNNVVADFTTEANKVYVIEYVKTPATYHNDGGKTYADATAFAAAGTLYTDAACTNVADSWDDGTTYYKRTGVQSVGVYTYKIVKVATVAP